MINDQTNQSLPDQDHSHAAGKDEGREAVIRHITDENHEISDDDIRNIQVGGPAQPDETTVEAIEEGEKRIADHKSDRESDLIPGSQKMTPWDTIG
jgi:hypothetical protein